MFSWFRGQSWNRRTRWTPLLENQRAFQRTLAKERSRVDRNGTCFGFIILRLEDLRGAKAQTVQLAKLLHQRLRDTDEKGHLGFGRIGVMLPETGAVETEFVLRELLGIAARHNLRLDGEALVYPDQDQTRPRDPEYFEEDFHLPIGSESADSSLTARAGVSKPLASTGFHRDASARMSADCMLPRYPSWKRSMDVAGALTGLVVGSPLLLAAAGMIKLTSRGPVLFCQDRTGYLGRPFKIYKLRSMVVNAEELKSSLDADNERDGPAFKMRKDPRITAVGRFLRATGLDELPQLYNVLRGDMAIVGPRPLPVDEAAQCSAWQRRRQEVRPGLTCFWQIAKSRRISFQDWMRLDLQYARERSLGVDLKLIMRTVTSVVLGRVGH